MIALRVGTALRGHKTHDSVVLLEFVALRLGHSVSNGQRANVSSLHLLDLFRKDITHFS